MCQAFRFIAGTVETGIQQLGTKQKLKSKRFIEMKDWITIPEAADYACVSHQTVRKWVQSQCFPVRRLPAVGKQKNGHVRIEWEVFEAFVAGMTNNCAQSQKSDATV
jgi:hypothetical protein